jgi:hypothetical protein
MYEYLYVLVISLVFIYLVHYTYEQIKESITYCSHHECYQNYVDVGTILKETSKSEDKTDETENIENA